MATVRVMEEMTGMKIEKEAEDEKVNVCKAIQGIEERGRADGIQHEQKLTKALLNDNRIDVFCKTFLHKIAKTFCRSLQLHFVGNCKPGWQSWYLPAI